MKDHEYGFEEVVISYLGRPKTIIYFANMIKEDEIKAMLFTICMREIHIVDRGYSEEELDKLKDFRKNLFNEEAPKNTRYDCIEFLHKMREKFNII